MGRKNKNSTTVTIRGSANFAFGPTGTAVQVISLPLNPNNLSAFRLGQAAGMFSLFRFTKLKFQMPGVGETADFLLAYTSVIDVNVPTTLDEAAESDQVSMLCSFAAGTLAYPSTPYFFQLGRKELMGKGAVKWWQCNTATSGGAATLSVLSTQGVVYACDSGTWNTDNALGIIWYECEFTDAGGFSANPPRPLKESSNSSDDQLDILRRRPDTPDIRVPNRKLAKAGRTWEETEESGLLEGVSKQSLIRELVSRGASRATRSEKEPVGGDPGSKPSQK